MESIRRGIRSSEELVLADGKKPGSPLGFVPFFPLRRLRKRVTIISRKTRMPTPAITPIKVFRSVSDRAEMACDVGIIVKVGVPTRILLVRTATVEMVLLISLMETIVVGMPPELVVRYVIGVRTSVESTVDMVVTSWVLLAERSVRMMVKASVPPFVVVEDGTLGGGLTGELGGDELVSLLLF